MGYSWKSYGGTQIFYCDYSGLKPDEMIKFLHETCDVLRKTPNKVPLLVNFENTVGTTEYMNEVKRLGTEVIAPKTTKMALLGISGVKSVLLQGYALFTGQKNIKSFKTEKEAMEWLVSP
jgi:hypothetical protein